MPLPHAPPDGMLRRILAGAILIGMTAVAELGFGLRHARTSALVRGGLIC